MNHVEANTNPCNKVVYESVESRAVQGTTAHHRDGQGQSEGATFKRDALTKTATVDTSTKPSREIDIIGFAPQRSKRLSGVNGHRAFARCSRPLTSFERGRKLKTQLTNADPAGHYLCDRHDGRELVVHWSGQSLRMANISGGDLPREYFSNFRRLVVEDAAGKRDAVRT